MSTLDRLLALPAAAVELTTVSVQLATSGAQALREAVDDGTVARVALGIAAVPDLLRRLDALLARLDTLPSALQALPAVPERLDALLDELVPVLTQLGGVLPSLEDTTRVLSDLEPLLAQAQALAGWVVSELSPQRHLLITTLTRIDSTLGSLTGTGDDVVALRGSVERFAEVLDSVSGQLASLPGAAIIRRRAAREHTR